jgi:hypothetical protein
MKRIRMPHEHPLQRQIADALRLELAPPGKVSRDGVAWWSIDHASYAGTAPGPRVGRGIVAGVPDLFVLHRGIAHMIEIKTLAGELSDPQQSVMSAVLASGGRVGVVRDADEMLGLLDTLGYSQGSAFGVAGECRCVRSGLSAQRGLRLISMPSRRPARRW